MAAYLAGGMGDAGRRFAIVSLSTLVMFAIFIMQEIANIRRTEVHKGRMLLAKIPLMHATMARLFMTTFAPANAKGPPAVLSHFLQRFLLIS